MIETLERLDHALLLSINSTHSPFFDQLMWYLSETWPTILLLLLTAYFLYRRFNLRKAVWFLVGCGMVFACCDLTSNLMKHSVKRYRPTHHTELSKKIIIVNDYRGGQYGFFSGHAANTFGLVTFAYLNLRWTRKKYLWLVFIYPLLVVYSRMYLGVHYPSDILFGMIDGLLFGSLIFLLTKKYFLKLHEEPVH
jgi:undecaprenyl-diphosphatase